MTKLKLLSAALIAAATLARGAYASAFPTARYIDGRVGISAPRVAAFPPAPPHGENCDVGDNPFIC